MEWVLSNLRYVHIAAGFIGLTAFWIPIVTKKGGKQHRLFGRIFKYAAYIVLAAAGLAVIFRLNSLISDAIPLVQQTSSYATYIFLGYLTLVTFVILRHGQLVLQHKSSLASMNTWPNQIFAGLAIVASISIIIFAVTFKPDIQIILYALSPIGISSGIGIIQVIHSKQPKKKAWLYEHIGAMLGCGIAFHTAFAVFGASRLFGDSLLPGNWAVLPWIAPTLIGIPATIIWTRHYKSRFNDH